MGGTITIPAFEGQLRPEESAPLAACDLAVCHPPVCHPPVCHKVQLYSADSQALVRNVGEYLHEGLKHGDGVLVIATPEHRREFERSLTALGSDVAGAIEQRQLLFVDAQSLLLQLMAGEGLERARFERIAGISLRQVQPKSPDSPRRAYGEMVGLLWSAGQFAAAERLEACWNTLLADGGFQLYCAYPIDVFGAEFGSPAADAVLRSHTHLISSGDSRGAASGGPEGIHAAVTRAAGELWPEIPAAVSSLPELPPGEAKILWLLQNRAADAAAILERARQHYGAERRFRALIENSSDAIALLDPTGRILYASPSTLQVLGHKPGEITGMGSGDLIHSDDRLKACRMLRNLLTRPRTPVRLELRARRGNGSWGWVEVTGSNLLDEPDIAAVVFNYHDIDDRKSVETALMESEAALRNANAGLEQFAYAAAHDLQEPIRNVAIYIELLARKCQDKLDDEANQFIKVALDGALRMQTLTRDLLNFTRSLDDPASPSKAGAPKPAAVFTRAMEEVLANLRIAIEESDAEISWLKECDSLPPLPIHHSHLVQVFQNLVSNALKYRGANPPRVEVFVEGTRREWVITVADNGIGIAPEYTEQIFGMFKRLHGREIPGNGIGLAICSRIVSHYQGRIQVQQRPGGGSVFLFTLPRENAHEYNCFAA